MLMAQTGGLVTAVTELDGNRLVMMMDVEKVLGGNHQYR
jgi:two-component system, chemotaxis family, chemotaxis protein CheV